MRVLHLIETLGRGGAEQLLVTLLPGLARQGIEPLVGVLRVPHDLAQELEGRGIEVIALPAFGRWNLAAARSALGALCGDRGVDIIHAHLYFPSIYAAYAALRGGVPMVETFHNLAYAGANADGWKLAARRRLRSFLLKRGGSRFYGVSQAVANHYAEALGLAEVQILPNVIDLSAIDAVETDIRDDTLRISVPGRLVAEKGHADLIDALAEGGFPPVNLHFIGGGLLEKELIRKAEVAGVNLYITGPLPHEEFLRQIAAMDIVVLPSRYEGFGIAAAEAMALGKPVIASGAGGLPEVVGNDGLLFPVGDVAALRAALTRLVYNEALRRQIGKRARQSARERFGPSCAVRTLAHDYRTIIEQRGCGVGGNRHRIV